MPQNHSTRRKRRFPISLVMIVRDEETDLGRCLASVQGLVDEIVVVDTGSVDGTVAVAESYGAKVSHFTWVDDFAAARNFALAQATHPWRLVLDADEWIANSDQAPAVFDQVGQQVPTFIGQVSMLQVSEETGGFQDTVPVSLPRLLPRQVQYVGRIHEQLTPELRPLEIGVLLGHDGYTTAAKERKAGRNEALLETSLAEDPTNAYLRFQLGTEYYARGRYEEALPHLIEAYNLLHPEGPDAVLPERLPWWHLLTMRLMLALMTTGHLEEAVAVGEQEADAWADSGDLFYVLGDAARRLSRTLLSTNKERADALLTSAIGCWIHAVDQGDSQRYAGALKERATVLAARELVELYSQLGRLNDAEKYRSLAAGADAAVAVGDRDTSTASPQRAGAPHDSV